MIFVPLHHALRPVDVSIAPLRRVGKPAPIAAVHAEAVRLQIRFINHIQAVLIAQIQPVGIVWVMRRADAVDVVLLHELNVLDHVRSGRDMAKVRVRVMAVDPPQRDRHAVQQQPSISDFILPEADCKPLHRLHPGLRSQRQQQRV